MFVRCQVFPQAQEMLECIRQDLCLQNLLLKMTANRLGTRKEGFQELDPALEKIRKEAGVLDSGLHNLTASLQDFSLNFASTLSSFSVAGSIMGWGFL